MRFFPGRDREIRALRIHTVSLWCAVTLYYGWKGGARLGLINALPRAALILLCGTLAGALLLLVVRTLKENEKNRLRAIIPSVLGGLIVFRGIFGLLDAAFFTPLTEGKLPAMAVLFGCSLGLGALVLYLLYRFISSGEYGAVRLRKLTVLTLIPAVLVSVAGIIGLVAERRTGTVPGIVRPPDRTERLNALLIVVDALRADHLGCYGYGRKTSPHLDALAAEGVRFEQCYTPVSWTKPSVASLLTSRYPAGHGAMRGGDLLPEEMITLGERFRDAGWRTAAFVANPHLKSVFNFDQGFDRYDDSLTRDSVFELAARHLDFFPLLRSVSGRNFDVTDRDNAGLLTPMFLTWLLENGGHPFFVYLHYMDPHAPYAPPPEYLNLFPPSGEGEVLETISLYDGEIRFADEAIGRVFDTLKSLGIYDRTVIVVTSDHGEAFGEHGDFGHGHTIYQDQLRVPLIVKFPSCRPGTVVERPVSTLDILPTLLDLTTGTEDPQAEGTSLVEGVVPAEGGREKDIYVDLENYNGTAVLRGVVRAGRWKYIRTERSLLRDIDRDGNEELYDLQADPGEEENLILREPSIAASLREQLEDFDLRFPRAPEAPPAAEPDRETIQQIRALGYM